MPSTHGEHRYTPYMKKKTIIKFQELRKFIGQGKHSPLYNTNLDKYFKAWHS